ncbi:NlpC/P60 family protein [Allgaiera indica]|jgi:NlpC/P60 family putative phage cell wall peptidase|nr:NlpC/P60 family protein [Allgaiera indica]MDA3888227.1 NlpC/P60 family protein [Allgaiera sp.]SDX71607.1 putative phage cell wall peptidase, NlpC/P60 family [Allgaiera indica]
MPARIARAARGWIGTPYHDQASLKGVGCDCLGLLRGVWREVIGPEPLELTGPVPPYSRDWGETGSREVLCEAARAAMIEITIAEVRTGDVLLFRMIAGAVAKHCGIMMPNGQFIHASDRIGVIDEPLSTAWRRRIAFAFRFPERRP